ncbi:hypothetical protein DEJ03_05940 [Curtobacterium sp. MCLR17_043]|nr:hypothetical protein DEJ03_05940 [Curtobacterium sp. MCLR17_043]
MSSNGRFAVPEATVPAHEVRARDVRADGQEARCQLAPGLPSGAASGHDTPLTSAEWSRSVARRRRSRRFVTTRQAPPDVS